MFGQLSSQHICERPFCPFADQETETHLTSHFICVDDTEHKSDNDSTMSCSNEITCLVSRVPFLFLTKSPFGLAMSLPMKTWGPLTRTVARVTWFQAGFPVKEASRNCYKRHEEKQN